MSKEKDNSITIDGWQNGIADSPHNGFAEMRNVDVTIHPGAVVLTGKLSNAASPAVTGTFTADAATDVLTGPSLEYSIFGNSYSGFRAVTFTSSGTLPAGLSPSTIYYLTSLTNTTYKVSTSLTNANSSTYVNITDAGSGTHTLTTIDPTYFTHYAYDNAGSKLYAVDANCRVWQQDSLLWYLCAGNTLTSGSGNGLAIFKSYLFVFRDNAIDVIALSAVGTPGSWNNSWQTLQGGAGIHHSLTGQDDILYWGDNDGSSNPYIGSLQEVGTFDPSSSGTYVYNTGALILPKYKIVTALAELGENLEIGTSGKEIYPWNRIAASFALPIICQEKNITALTTINNQLYIACGSRGNLYVFNGYLAQPLKIFPKHLLNNDYNMATVGAMTALGRKLLFTLQTTKNSGIYSLDILTNALVMENTISSDSVGTSNPLTLPAIFSDGVTYWASWRDLDASTVGNDVSTDTGTYRYPTDSSAYIVSPNIDMGFFNIPRVLQYAEAYFDRILVSGHNLTLQYRTQLSGSFTTLATFNGDGINQVFQTPAAVVSGTDVQFKIILNGLSDAATTPYFQSLRVL